MREHSLPVLLGYDPLLLERLPATHQRQLSRVAEAWLLSCLLLASPLAYAVWLVEHSPWMAALAGVGSFLLVLNMLRLVAAGAGAAPHFTRAQVQAYRPALGATILIGMLALLFAQPAQLPLWTQTLAQPVAAHRQQMVAEHERSIAALGLDDTGDYRAKLLRCEFLVLRLTTLWQHPGRAARLTAVYLLLVLLPALGARMFALDSLRAYELLRWQTSRRAIAREAHATTRTVQSLLAAYPDYRPQAAHWADPPFDTRVVSPLLLPARRAPTAAAKKRWPGAWFRRGGAA